MTHHQNPPGVRPGADPTTSELERLGALARHVLLPQPTSSSSGGRLGTVRRVVGILTLVGTLVQVVVWLTIAVFSGSVDSPWWLLTTVGGVVLGTCLWIVDEYGVGHVAHDDGSRR